MLLQIHYVKNLNFSKCIVFTYHNQVNLCTLLVLVTSLQNFPFFFSVNNDIHSCNTRHASFFLLSFCRTIMRQFFISLQGLKF